MNENCGSLGLPKEKCLSCSQNRQSIMILTFTLQPIVNYNSSRIPEHSFHTIGHVSLQCQEINYFILTRIKKIELKQT